MLKLIRKFNKKYKNCIFYITLRKGTNYKLRIAFTLGDKLKLTCNAPYFLSAGNIEKIKNANVSIEGRHPKKNYNDPLTQWPARGLAYSNEIGAAISEVAPKTGLLLWIPALLYFGADIYDKYKNDKNSYDPSTKRGTRQAIFQLLASVILPTAAVKFGQKVASAVAIKGKHGLTLQSQEELHRFTIDYIKQNKLHKYADKQDEYYTKFAEKLANHIDETKKESKFENIIVRFVNWLFNREQPEAVTRSTSKKIEKFTNNNIKQIFKIREKLMNDTKPEEFSDKLFQKFKQVEQEFKSTKGYTGDAKEDAAKHVIKMFQEKQIFKNKLLKTVGGFIALGLLVKPIDKFVEHFVIDKFVEPRLTMLEKTQIKEFKEKNMAA